MVRKINDEEMLKMLKEGKTQREVARHFKVSEPAVSKRIRRLLPPPKSFENLTDKEQKFVREIISGRTQMQSALNSFDVNSLESAKSLGSHLMAKPDIQLAVSQIMQQEGLSKRYRVRKLKTHVDAKDPGISLKALDQSWRLDGEYREQVIHHIIDYNALGRSLREIEQEIEVERAKLGTDVIEGQIVGEATQEQEQGDSKETVT